MVEIKFITTHSYVDQALPQEKVFFQMERTAIVFYFVYNGFRCFTSLRIKNALSFFSFYFHLQHFSITLADPDLSKIRHFSTPLSL